MDDKTSGKSSATTFASKLGVIAATVGSAVGLGNVWRFPAEAQAGGGGAFLLVYLVCVFVLGIPAMLAETSLGRAGRSDSVGNIKRLTPGSHWWIAGTFGLLASYLILSFYMVVAGWTFEYTFQSITGNLYDGFTQGSQGQENAFFTGKMTEYVTTAWRPLFWTVLVILTNLFILIKGVQQGIEKMSNVLMPLLVVLLLVFCYASLTLPGASEGVKFFLQPDFSKITVDVVISALGQAFFSLSLGMGVLVTYSAYYPRDTRLTGTATTVAMLDTAVAILMGLIIFPAVKSFGIEASTGQLEGTTLVFVTLPDIFAAMPGTRIWSTLFFLLLAVAALTSTVSIAEVSVAFARDRFGLSRTRACLVVILPLIATGALCSLSLGALPQLKLAGLPLFDFLDNFATNILLPVSALALCLYVGWKLPRTFIKDELSNHGTIPARMAPFIAVLIRVVVPVLIVAILLSKILTL